MKQPLRILHVVTIMNLGGIENFLMTLYRNLDKSKIQFDFLVHRKEKGVFDDEIERLGGRIYCVDALRPLAYMNYRRKLRRFFLNHPYKIVHSHLNANSTLVLSIAKSMNVPIRIAHSHADGAEGNVIIKNILKKGIVYYSTHRFSCSIKAGKWLFNSNENFEVFNNSIDSLKFEFNSFFRQDKRNSLGVHEGDILVGHLGRFNEVKNHKFLIEVFANFKKNNSNAKLLLIGDGELKDAVFKQVEDLGLVEDVIFTGAILNANEFLCAMDVFVFCSKFEGLGICLIEAQCNGLPILLNSTLSDEAELTNLFTRKSLNNSPEIWAEEIYRICNNFAGNDRTRYKKDIILNNYDVVANANYIQSFYLNLL